MSWKRVMLQALEFQAHQESINSCKWLEEDKLIVTCSADKTVCLWKSFTGELLQELPAGHSHNVSCVDGDNDSTRLLSSSWDRSAIYWDYNTAQKIWRVNHDSLVTCCSLYPANNVAMTTCDDAHFYVWDTRLGSTVASNKEQLGHSSSLTCCQFSHCGTYIATTSMDRTARVWDARFIRPLLKLDGHVNVVSSCKFSHNDHFLCCTSWDKTIRLYNLSAGTYRTKGAIVLFNHDGCVSSCDFSDDDSTLVSCGYDLYVSLWSTRSCTVTSTLKGHNNWIQDIHFGKDKRWMLSCSKDGMVKVWDCEGGNIKQNALKMADKMLKCSQCGRLFLTCLDPASIQICLCVFCRLEDPHRALENIIAKIH